MSTCTDICLSLPPSPSQCPAPQSFTRSSSFELRASSCTCRALCVHIPYIITRPPHSPAPSRPLSEPSVSALPLYLQCPQHGPARRQHRLPTRGSAVLRDVPPVVLQKVVHRAHGILYGRQCTASRGTGGVMNEQGWHSCHGKRPAWQARPPAPWPCPWPPSAFSPAAPPPNTNPLLRFLRRFAATPAPKRPT